jgi:hypothetical protein
MSYDRALGPAGSKTGVSYPDDVPETYAEVDDLTRYVGFGPAAAIETGIQRFMTGMASTTGCEGTQCSSVDRCSIKGIAFARCYER